MKTKIIINGDGVSSKLELLKRLRPYESQVKEIPVNNFVIHYKNRGDAVKALSEAFQAMHSDEETKRDIRYVRGSYLSYGQGKAEIYKP